MMASSRARPATSACSAASARSVSRAPRREVELDLAGQEHLVADPRRQAFHAPDHGVHALLEQVGADEAPDVDRPEHVPREGRAADVDDGLALTGEA